EEARAGRGAIFLRASARVGPVRYLAPELAGSNPPADERSDISSLGATLYHALTGVPLFSGPSAWDVLSQHMRAQPPSPRRRAPEISRSLADLIVRMLAKKPGQRPQSFAEILEDPGLAESRTESEWKTPRGAW